MDNNSPLLTMELVEYGIVKKMHKRPDEMTLMLTVRKIGGRPRLVHDFRILNSITKIMQNNVLDRLHLLSFVLHRRWWILID